MIYVTGGTGFLGRNLIPCLVERGHTIRVLTRTPEQHPWLNAYEPVEVVAGDVTDAKRVQETMRGCRYAIHAAGLFRMWGRPQDFERTNVQGTRHVAEAARHHHVERLVHVSTIAVIGHPQPGQIIDETHPPSPADAYQRSKLAGEAVIHSTAERGLPAVILRPGAFYGPYGRYAFNRLFFEDPLKGLLIKVDGGKNIIFPVYIGDVAAAICNALHCGATGETYNICGDPLTHNEANDIVSDAAGMTRFRINAPTWGMITLARAWTWLSQFTHVEPYYPINLRSYVFNDWQVSSQKARDELCFRPTDFREGAAHTLAWYRAEGYHWAR